ncbi:MAG: hypothetical protein RL557_321 [archaeon]|jgi:arginyl-tRNA synthetase
MFKEKIVTILEETTKLPKEKINALLEVPPTSDLGDYSFPCFFLSNPKNYDDMWKDVEKDFFIEKSPIEIAQHLKDLLSTRIKKIPQIENIQTKGPYLNFFVNKKLLAKYILDNMHESYGKGKKKGKIMVEYCHANTHKAFHVGHTRNIALGESICRILENAGYKVVRANYQGDVGMHVAKTLWGFMNLKKLNLEMPKKDQGKWLGIVYAKASAAAEDETIKKEINEINQRLYAGDKKLSELWKKTRQWSIDYFETEVYPDFDVHFDRFYFESEVEKTGIQMAKKLLKNNVAQLSEGAIIMDLEKYNLGIFLILKSDETPLYSTKDLYLAELMDKEHNPERILHIVGSEQKFYFQQLFKTLELFNPKNAKKQQHISYELVNLPTGKMKSREGKVILYDDTRDKIKELVKKELLKRNKELKQKELEEKTKKITLGAIKYAMLSQSTHKTIIFNEQDVTNFDGDTGPYLQYAYARASSIMKKSKKKAKHTIPQELTEKEAALIKKIAQFLIEIKRAEEKLDPSIIAHYAYHLAQLFNEFYHTTKVIDSEEEAFRLKLVDAFRTTMKNALYLLGIEVMDEM